MATIHHCPVCGELPRGYQSCPEHPHLSPATFTASARDARMTDERARSITTRIRHVARYARGLPGFSLVGGGR